MNILSSTNCVYLQQSSKVGNIIPKLKKFYKELFGKSFPEKIDGLDIIQNS
jgi:hypothetical protein